MCIRQSFRSIKLICQLGNFLPEDNCVLVKKLVSTAPLAWLATPRTHRMEASSLGPGVRSRSLKLEVVPEEEAGVVEVNRESKLKKVSEWLYRR